MTAIVSKSTARDPNAIAEELSKSLGDMRPTFLLLFCSSKLDVPEICGQLERRFKGVPSLGCTTAGELACTEASTESVVLLAVDAGTIEHADVVAIEDARSEQALSSALDQLSRKTEKALSELDPTRLLGLVLHDGLSSSEERVMATLSNATNVPFVGGSAGDDLAFQKTQVMANFKVRPGSSALAILAPAHPYLVVKTQSLTPSSTVLVATDVDEATRTVRTFNGEPALAAYAKALGLSEQAAVKEFIKRPLGLVVGPDEVYTRSPQQVTDEGVRFYCEVKQGMKLHLLDPEDIVERTRHDLEQALSSFGKASCIINFNCIQRALLLRDDGREAEFAKLFTAAPMAGFSTYGESYVGHINQTATMVLLG